MKLKPIIISTAIAVSLVGCSSNNSKYRDIQPDQMMTTQEVLDYYAKEMSYKPITQYNILNNNQLSFNTVKGDMYDKAVSAYKKVISEYKKNSNFSLSEGQHDYLKYFIDNMVITEDSIVAVKEAMGYYYVEVNYNTGSNTVGSFKPTANYLGIDGIIIEDYYGDTVIDDRYLESAIKSINEYRKSNGDKLLTTQGLEVGEGGKTIDNQVGNVGSITYTDKVRKLDYDVSEFNKVVGSSKEQIAFMPSINFVYEPTNIKGTANGYGIFPAGEFGLKDFGYNRLSDSGKLTVTYIFKQNELNGNELTYQLCYINSYNNDNKLSKYIQTVEKEDGTVEEVMSETTVPEFIKKELSKVIERLDRAVCNRDISALMNTEIVEDAGLGMLYGMYGENSQIVSFVSNVNKVIDRNNNVYLLELERTVEDAAKGTNTTAVYNDTYYAVVRQENLVFKVNDIVMVSRELVRAPEPDPDNASYRRLVALNLSGPISQANKDSITLSLNTLYKASTERKLSDMYARFNSNKELLTEEKLEYLNSKLRGYLIAQGTNQPAVMSGKVTSWIGGYDTQAELTTEELIEYTGLDRGMYIKFYYLMSNYGTEWLIDDIVVISEQEVEGQELADLKIKLSE